MGERENEGKESKIQNLREWSDREGNSYGNGRNEGKEWKGVSGIAGVESG